VSASQTEAKGQHIVELRIPARAENLALARLALAGIGAIAGAREDVIADLKVSVTEACTNSIQHAYAGRAGNVVVRYRAAGEVLEVEVADDGSGFDTNDPGNDSVEGSGGQGMGLMIIRELSDEVRMESDESGSRIVFSRRVDKS
jgi:serine/threonine-protein kinase RsbW